MLSVGGNTYSRHLAFIGSIGDTMRVSVAVIPHWCPACQAGTVRLVSDGEGKCTVCHTRYVSQSQKRHNFRRRVAALLPEAMWVRLRLNPLVGGALPNGNLYQERTIVIDERQVTITLDVQATPRDYFVLTVGEVGVILTSTSPAQNEQAVHDALLTFAPPTE